MRYVLSFPCLKTFPSLICQTSGHEFFPYRKAQLLVCSGSQLEHIALLQFLVQKLIRQKCIYECYFLYVQQSTLSYCTLLAVLIGMYQCSHRHLLISIASNAFFCRSFYPMSFHSHAKTFLFFLQDPSCLPSSLPDPMLLETFLYGSIYTHIQRLSIN